MKETRFSKAITRLQVGILIAVVIIAGVAAVAYYVLLPPKGEQVIKLGITLPLSPPGAYEAGIKEKWAFELAIDEVNANGGINGKQVVGIFEDTAGLPEKGTTAAIKLITQDNVDMIVGEFHSSVAIAISEVCHTYNKLFVDTEAWADAITLTHYPTIFRMCPFVSYASIYMVDCIKQLGWKNIVTLYESTDAGILEDSSLAAELTSALGFSYYSVKVELTATDFTAVMTGFKARTPQPDLLLLLVTGTAGFLAAKQAFEVGLSPQTQVFAWAGEPAYPEFWDTVGQAGVGELFENVAHPKAYLTDVGQTFREAFLDRTGGIEPDHTIYEAKDTLIVVEEAIKNAGTTETGAVITALKALNVTGTRGPIFFTTNTTLNDAMWNCYLVPFYILQYTANNQAYGDCEIIYPPISKTADYKPQQEFFT